MAELRAAPKGRTLIKPKDAKNLGVGRSTIYRWIADGLVPISGFDGGALIDPEDVLRVKRGMQDPR